MKLKVGDKIVCIKEIHGGDKIVCSKEIHSRDNKMSLIYGKTYTIINTTTSYIAIDVNGPWWFGQIGSSEPWTKYFVLEKQWTRNKKLEELGF